MKVTVRKRGERWQVDYFWPPHRAETCELRHGATACGCGTKRIRRSFETRKLADGIAAEIQHKAACGEFKGPAEAQARPVVSTFAELAALWLSDPENADWSPATADYYGGQVKAWRLALGERFEGKTWRGSSRLVADVTPDDIRRTVGAAWNRGKSPVRGNRLLSTARTLFRYAVGLGVIAADPSAKLAKRTEPKRGHVVTAEQEAAWLCECSSAEADVLTLFLNTAARLGDPLGDCYGKPPLTWRLVHLAGGCACPESEIEGPHLYLPHDKTRRTKERAPRYVPLNAAALGVLKRYHEAARLRCKGAPSGPVFLNSRGEPATAQQVARNLKAAAVRAGLPASIRTHDTRHTSITRMERSGLAHSRDVMAAVGHREAATHARYIHAEAAGKRAALDALTVTQVSQDAPAATAKGA